MSYRRRVHCRHCGETGHNINGCQKLKEYAKNNPNSWSAQRMKEKAEAAKHRKCSYCNEEKHNRKTCNHIIQDMVTASKINSVYRRTLVDYCKKNGVGVGALISVKSLTGYDKDGNYKDFQNALALVTEVDLSGSTYPEINAPDMIKVEFCNVYAWNGKGIAKESFSIPHWKLAGLPKPDGWYTSDPFDVVSPGYFMMDNEEEFIIGKDVIRRIVDECGSHRDFQYKIDNSKYFKI